VKAQIKSLAKIVAGIRLNPSKNSSQVFVYENIVEGCLKVLEKLGLSLGMEVEGEKEEASTEEEAPEEE